MTLPCVDFMYFTMGDVVFIGEGDLHDSLQREGHQITHARHSPECPKRKVQDAGSRRGWEGGWENTIGTVLEIIKIGKKLTC